MANQYKFSIVGSDKTRRMFKSLRRNLGGLRRAVNSTQLKVGALAGAAGLGAVVRSSLATNDALAKTADRLGLTTRELEAYRHQANLTGSDNAGLDKSLELMNRNLGDAARGTGEAKDAIADLGLNVHSLIQMPTAQRFETIAEAIRQTGDRTTQASMAADIFGRSGTQLVNLIDQGAAGLNKAKQKVDDYGVALTRVDAAQMEAANDAMFRASQIGRGLGNQLTLKLAPVIEELAVQFAEAARAGGGMGQVVEKAFRKGVATVGVFADGIHGLKVIFHALKTAAQGVFALLATGFAGAVKWAGVLKNHIIDGIAWPLRQVIALMAPFSERAAQALQDFDALVLSMKDKAPEGLLAFAEAQRQTFTEMKGQLHELMLAELPSKVMAENLDAVLAAAEARAQQIAASAQANAGLGGGANDEGDGTGKGADGLTDTEREQLATRLETLKLSWLTELQQLQVKQDQEMATLDQAYAQKLIKHDEYERNLYQLEQKHAKEREKLEQASGKSRVNSVLGAFQSMLGVAGQGNKKLFKLQKALSLAQAAASLPSAVIESYKNAGGYPWGIPAAAAMAAAGAAQIAQIKSASFNGGGSNSAPSVGGGGAMAGAPASQGASLAGVNQFAANDRQQPGTIVQLTVNGDVVGGGVEAIAGRLGQLMSEQDLVIIDPNSRQAQELRSAGTG